MPGNPPTDATVQQILKGAGDPWRGQKGDMRQTYEEVLFEGDGRTRKVFAPADFQLPVGGVVKGWFNDEKSSFTVAADQSENPAQSGTQASLNGGRDDATGRSIERQVAAYAAAYMASALGGGETGGPVVLANFEQFFDTVIGKIQGADKPADDVPFD